MALPPPICAEMRAFYRVFGPMELSLGRHRARCLTVRLPMPPVRPVRETFTSYGSRQRDIMGKVHFASSTVHSPWTALRVRWVPLYCFPTLSLRAFAMYAAFPHADYYALFDCLQGLGAFGAGLPCLLPTLLPIPSRLSRVHSGGLQQDAVGGVLLGVPSALCGSSVVPGGKTGGPPGLWCTTYGWSPQGYSSVRERVSH